MKQIIPFKKDLLLKTKASEITSVSLEHEFKIENDLISGNFHITGDYKMTEGSINRENFDFVLPFDIALDSRYKEDSIEVDIDNFYYKLVNDDTLEVNIDLYIDGEKEEKEEDINKEVALEDRKNDISNFTYEDLVKNIEKSNEDDLEKEKEAEISIENVNNNTNTNISINDNTQESNIFDNISDSDTYKTYYVYIMKEEDTIDKILEKYNISKEELSLYNNIDDIKSGDKIIIPSVNE